jgi:hypothetical protein
MKRWTTWPRRTSRFIAGSSAAGSVDAARVSMSASVVTESTRVDAPALGSRPIVPTLLTRASGLQGLAPYLLGEIWSDRKYWSVSTTSVHLSARRPRAGARRRRAMASRDVGFVEETLRSWGDDVGSNPARGDASTRGRSGDDGGVEDGETRIFVPTDEQRAVAAHLRQPAGPGAVRRRWDETKGRRTHQGARNTR